MGFFGGLIIGYVVGSLVVFFLFQISGEDGCEKKRVNSEIF
jgi:hypothetical protein